MQKFKNFNINIVKLLKTKNICALTQKIILSKMIFYRNNTYNLNLNCLSLYWDIFLRILNTEREREHFFDIFITYICY